MRRRSDSTQLSFEAIAIEGGLLSPDWLARAAQLEAGDQSETDYRIPKGLNLRDEIGRYWRIAQALWNDLASGHDAAGADERKTRALSERFVTALLRECFGFGSLTTVEPVRVDDRPYPIGHAALEGRVPVVIAPAGMGLDALSSAFGDGTRRRSAFGLCQEFLNAEDGALWGLACDGVTLRMLRDNASLTRPAWIEADLHRIFTEERYADFAALWLLAHETRFGRPARPVTECALEVWREAGREEGTRARALLRYGVKEALIALGQGFLAHAENQALRVALASGGLTKQAYFQELLRLAYRLIFLLTVEERGVLHPGDSGEAELRLYADGYSLRRLRERAAKRSAHDRNHDHWESTKIVFRGLASGEPRLALPALAGIFGKEQCAHLDAARLENRFLLLALFRLSWLREDAGLSRVNWRDMGPEELGSVYESLLELVPQITEGGRTFGFATGAETKGHARKTTGSYYTPDSLVQVLLDSAVEPVVERTIAEHPTEPVEALLSLAVVDPACGSGHFLLAAARRLAARVARLNADGTPSAAQYRHALRQVVGRCIYGVDLNPMAVELCKVSLWMEAVEPGLPLTFLDSHIRHGNALLGATPELMENGVPDDAWKPIEGDDKKVASALRKRNKESALGQRGLDTLWSSPKDDEADDLRKAIADLESAPDADVAALADKQSRWQDLLDSNAYQHQKLVADAWCAAFVWPKQPGALAAAAPTNELWRQIRDGQGHPPELTLRTVNELAEQYTFFHWHLGFPQAFARGGFDVVLGNPPWERVKLQEKEFFASRSPEIAEATNAAIRKRAIADLASRDPTLFMEWTNAKRLAEGASHLARNSGRYPRCGLGDINTYALFAEAGRQISSESGRAACIVPTGIATENTTRGFFSHLVDDRFLVALYGFENEGKLFPGIDHRVNFCVLTTSGRPVDEPPQFAAFLRHPDLLARPERRYSLNAQDIALINPNTKTCPVFRYRRDAEITKAIYRRVPVLWKEGEKGNQWGVQFRSMFHMSNDSKSFLTKSDLIRRGCTLVGNTFECAHTRALPLWEAKMVHLFNHRFGDFSTLGPKDRSHILPQVSESKYQDPHYSPIPRYWVDEDLVEARLEGFGARKWLVGWRDVTDARSSVRTLVSAVIPRTACSGEFQLLISSQSPACSAFLFANLCSFVLDYVCRQKLGGVHLKHYAMKQLPVLPPHTCSAGSASIDSETWGEWTRTRVLELAYTAWDLEPFARDVGYEGPPFRWDPERRFLLRAELDAAFFHLYNIEHDDVDYIMETFPIVRKNDDKTHGEYRTKRVVLEIYDEMAAAADSGKPYRTRLDPPPADPRVSHPARAQVSASEASR